MSRAARLNSQIADLEANYRTALIAALRACAEGRWGLFGHNPPAPHAPAIPAGVEDLMRLGETIDGLRAKLGDGPLPLHAAFIQARGRKSENDPGEPKLALAWLSRLDA